MGTDFLAYEALNTQNPAHKAEDDFPSFPKARAAASSMLSSKASKKSLTWGSFVGAMWDAVFRAESFRV